MTKLVSRRVGAGAIFLAALALGISGCGSSGASNGNPKAGGTTDASTSTSQGTGGSNAAGVADAKKLLAHYAKLPDFQPPGSSFDGSKARGHLIFFVSDNLSSPFEQTMSAGLKAAAKAVGAKATIFDGKGSATEWSRGIGQAITAHASVIINDGVPPGLVGPALAQAKAAGIPVISADTQDAGQSVTNYPPAIVAQGGHSFSIPGKLLAAAVVADSNGKASTAYFTTSDAGDGSAIEAAAFKQEYETLCPSCKLKVLDSPLSQWNGMASITSSLIQANPDINYLIPGFDGMVTFMLTGVQSSGASNRVKIGSFNGSLNVMQALKARHIVFAEVGGPNAIEGWALADQAFRIIAGVAPLTNLGLPIRYFDKSNIDSVPLTQTQSKWYTSSNYQAAYEKLWQIR